MEEKVEYSVIKIILLGSESIFILDIIFGTGLNKVMRVAYQSFSVNPELYDKT
jgi:hypothetical protein